MQQIMLVLAILLLIIIVPGRNSEKAAEQESLTLKMQPLQEKLHRTFWLPGRMTLIQPTAADEWLVVTLSSA